jgi:hypothetical protein
MRFTRNNYFFRMHPLSKVLQSGPFLAFLLLSAGCSTISQQALVIESEPEGAYAYVNSRFIGQTPITQRVNRQVPHQVELRMVGFHSQEVDVFPYNREAQRFLVVGPLEDSGYYRDLRPNPVKVEMVYSGIPPGTTELTVEEQDKLLVRIAEEETNNELTPEQASYALQQVLGLSPPAETP